ncbi:hypothetical protein ACTXT7_010138, partial [Hymenolepis weldensis]
GKVMALIDFFEILKYVTGTNKLARPTALGHLSHPAQKDTRVENVNQSMSNLKVGCNSKRTTTPRIVGFRDCYFLPRSLAIHAGLYFHGLVFLPLLPQPTRTSEPPNRNLKPFD